MLMHVTSPLFRLGLLSRQVEIFSAEAAEKQQESAEREPQSSRSNRDHERIVEVVATSIIHGV